MDGAANNLDVGVTFVTKKTSTTYNSGDNETAAPTKACCCRCCIIITVIGCFNICFSGCTIVLGTQ